jgi:hypothetical protein
MNSPPLPHLGKNKRLDVTGDYGGLVSSNGCGADYFGDEKM